MSLNRSLEQLHPAIRAKAERFLESLAEAGIAVYVNETVRSIEVQKAYYSQGREPLESVNTLRSEAGLPPITASENRYPVTWTMESKHIDGLAIDIVPMNRWGKPWWGAPEHLWRRIGEIGESCGLIWGGRWKKTPDRPHFEVSVDD